MGSKCKTCGLTERSHHPCNEAGTLYPCPDEFHREMSIVQCQQPGCTANGLTRARGWWCAIHHPEHPMGPVTPTPPAPAMRHWQHDETGRVCDCVDCPGPRYHEVNEAFAEAHEKAMREKCGTPAPADDASGAEAMRADFLAWVNAGYLVRDAVTDVEWDDEGLPLYYTRNDGVRHYLDGEWHAWQAARALPLPARDDAVEEAMAPGCHEHVALWDAINAYSAACGGHPTRGGGARMDAVVRVEKALRAALRGTRPEGHGGGK